MSRPSLVPPTLLAALLFAVALPCAATETGSARGLAEEILEEAKVTSPVRREYILSQLERADLAGAVEIWSSGQSAVLEPAFRHGVLVEALNAEFAYRSGFQPEKLHQATATALGQYLAEVGSEGDPTQPAKPFSSFLRTVLGVQGLASPPGLRRYAVGRLQVDVTPVAADVLIDGQSLGRSDSVFYLLAGKHEIRGREDGYTECRGEVEVQQRRLTRFPCALKPTVP
jgi:PEGA domain